MMDSTAPVPPPTQQERLSSTPLPPLVEDNQISMEDDMKIEGSIREQTNQDSTAQSTGTPPPPPLVEDIVEPLPSKGDNTMLSNTYGGTKLGLETKPCAAIDTGIKRPTDMVEQRVVRNVKTDHVTVNGIRLIDH